jgi:hypothetical protein
MAEQGPGNFESMGKKMINYSPNENGGVNGPSKSPDLNDILNNQRENEELLRNRENEPIQYVELNILGFVKKLEKAEGSREEEGAIQWPESINLQQLATQEVAMKYTISVLTGYGEAKPVDDMTGWYTNVPPTYGFETKTVRVGEKKEDFTYETRVRLGDDTERKNRADRISKFTREAYARMKFAGLYGHLFKKSIESISNLSALYLSSVDVRPSDVSALLSLPACPEDYGQTLKSVTGKEYPQGVALGRMMTTAWQIFNAVGLSEKPELFTQFVSQPGWQKNIGSDTTKFQEWFGNPTAWKKSVEPATWSPGQTDVRDKETWIKETSENKRGKLTAWGNIFVREESYEMPREFRAKVVEFLGDSETAKTAVDLGWKYFRLFAAADYVGYEWYFDNEDGQLHATIPLGADLTADFGKVMHPDAYLEMYHKNSRGGVPRGEYGKINPMAVDVLRGLQFGDNYKLSDGTVLKKPSLYELLFVHGVQPDQINYNRLPERAIIGPYLRFFMAAAGQEYGNGVFDMMTDKITSPDPYLSPAFWEKLRSKLNVGITAENVGWFNYLKNPANGYKRAGEEDVAAYRLEMIRVMLDGIFAEEISKKWDSEPDKWGVSWEGQVGNEEALGVSSEKGKGRFVSHRIIDAANNSISDLNYTLDRLIKIRKKFGMSVKEK